MVCESVCECVEHALRGVGSAAEEVDSEDRQAEERCDGKGAEDGDPDHVLRHQRYFTPSALVEPIHGFFTRDKNIHGHSKGRLKKNT